MLIPKDNYISLPCYTTCFYFACGAENQSPPPIATRLPQTAGSHKVRSGQLLGAPTVHIPGLYWSGWCRRQVPRHATVPYMSSMSQDQPTHLVHSLLSLHAPIRKEPVGEKQLTGGRLCLTALLFLPPAHSPPSTLRGRTHIHKLCHPQELHKLPHCSCLEAYSFALSVNCTPLTHKPESVIWLNLIYFILATLLSLILCVV